MTELIYSYWMEQGWLVQTVNAIEKVFTGQPSPSNQALNNCTFSSLRFLGNVLRGFFRDPDVRLGIGDRAREYMSQYGLDIKGAAVPELGAVDARPRFLRAFHSLLSDALQFYKDDDNTTVVADGFALLNALREVHMILADGAVNQFGDLTIAAREEMLIMQWLLSRPEMRQCLHGRPETPYPETWMEQVEAMKRLQNWPDISIIHIEQLARFGEQILLSIRYSDWMDDQKITQDSAKRWARFWRAEVRSYINAYCAVTGVNLAINNIDNRRDLQPSLHLDQRMSNATHKPSHADLKWASAQQNEYGNVPYGYAQPQRTLPMRRS